MSNQEIVKTFLSCYQNHDFTGMQGCLDYNVHFSDFAFDIHGKEVWAMWHWFCIPNPPARPSPIEVPEFDILSFDNDVVLAKYRVIYLNGTSPVDYFIDAHFRVPDGKIVEQTDSFGNISELEFAKMAFGLPNTLAALPPTFRSDVGKQADEKLKGFMQNHGY